MASDETSNGGFHQTAVIPVGWHGVEQELAKILGRATWLLHILLHCQPFCNLL